MMTEKKQYISPAAVTAVVVAVQCPLCASNPVPVNPGEEGDQSGADSRNYHRPFSLWDDEAEDE